MPLPTKGSARPPKLSLERLEDRTTPTFLPKTGLPARLIPDNPGLSIAVGNVAPDPGVVANNEYIVGTGPGRESLVRIFALNGQELGRFVPYVGFKGGVNVAVGDVSGDGANEIIVTAASNFAGLNIPQVKVFTPQGGLISQFNVFNPGYFGGLNVAVGNVLGGIGRGGFGGGNNTQFKSEIILGAAAGNSPHVVVTDDAGNYKRSFFAFDGGYLGGVTVAASSIDTTRTPGSGGGFFGGNRPDTNGYAEIIVGAATNIPHVKAFEVWQDGSGETAFNTGFATRLSYFAFDPALGRGVTVTAGSTDGNRGAEIYVGLIGDQRAGGTQIRAFNGGGSQIAEFQAFIPEYSRVVNMAIGNVATTFDPNDDDANSNFFNTQDLVAVAGDGPFIQTPRVFVGLPNSPAGRNNT